MKYLGRLVESDSFLADIYETTAYELRLYLMAIPADLEEVTFKFNNNDNIILKVVS